MFFMRSLKVEEEDWTGFWTNPIFWQILSSTLWDLQNLGIPEPRTVFCIAESLAQFLTSLLHYYILLSLLLFLPQGVMTIILLTAEKHIPEIMTILALELWTWDKCELQGCCYERIHTAPGTAMLTSMDAASSPSLVPFPLFQSTSGRCRSF